jgi:hypothetical protein
MRHAFILLMITAMVIVALAPIAAAPKKEWHSTWFVAEQNSHSAESKCTGVGQGD